MADTFTAQLEAWVHGVEGALEAIAKEGIQEVVSIAQRTVNEGGRMHVDTGFLRASISASTVEPIMINPNAKPAPRKQGKKGQPYYSESGNVTAVIAGWELGKPLYVGWTASYAFHREYGANGQPPDAFLRTAVQQWPDIISRKAQELKGRLGI